jgi:rubrerythrin
MNYDKQLTFNCILQLDLSEYEKGLLELPDAFTAVGYWRCDNCATGYLVPNEDGKAPRYCPFCGEPVWEKTEKAKGESK